MMATVGRIVVYGGLVVLGIFDVAMIYVIAEMVIALDGVTPCAPIAGVC